VQASYVAAGRFDVTVAGETVTLGAGDSFIVPPSAEHGVVVLEAGTLIDSFAPARADFL
jgi:quercetin dioxygenase-like cupin family protein